MKTGNTLYEQVLAGVPPPGGRPTPLRDSAAVVLWRKNTQGEVEVYWVRRAAQLKFMGGWYSFPGGAVSRRDSQAPFVEPGQEGGDRHPSSGNSPALGVCAIRELFEETGVLVAEDSTDGKKLSEEQLTGLPVLRRQLLEKQISFPEIVSLLGMKPAEPRLTFAGRWITPESAPIRFDARFFLLEWPKNEAQQPEIWQGELDAGEWIRPADALERRERGEVLIPPPGVYILEVLAREGPIRGLPKLQNPVGIDLGPFRRMEFLPGIFFFPLRTATLPPATHTNAYVLGHREMALVDPGCSEEAEVAALKEALKALLEESGRRFTGIWLTHHHRDHIGGVEALRDYLNVPVHAHRLTAEHAAKQGFRVDRELHDGEKIELKGEPPVTLRVIHTPGHTRGHLCFFEERSCALVAGDIVAGGSTIVIDPPEGDMDDYLASLEKLIELRPRYVLPGHGELAPDGVKKLREALEHRLWREEKVLKAWQSGIGEPQQMLPRVYDDVPPQAYPLAERQIIAHLERLRKLGRIG